MNIDDYFKTYTGGNSNVATWTPKAIKEFAKDYHTEQLNILGVSNSLDLVMLEKKLDEVLDNETSESLKKWLHSKRL